MAKATVHKLDMTNVKDGVSFNKKHYAPGDYKAKITKVEDAKNKDKKDKTPMWLFTIQVNTGLYPYYCKLQENQLWKVRNLCVAAGIAVPKKKTSIDPNKLVGKTIAVTLDDTEYEDKIQSEIAAVFPVSELNGDDGDDDDDDDDDDDEDTDDEDDDDSDDDDDDDDDSDDDSDDEDDEDEEDSDDEDDDDEDEDDEEEEEPVVKKKAKKADKVVKAGKKSAKKASKKSDDDDDDLDELDIDDV